MAGKRQPIDYTPQHSARMFRPADVVEAERAQLEGEPPAAQAADQVSDDTSERTDKRTDDRSDERRVIRHSFDIYGDQLVALTDIQARLYRQTGKKPKLGRLVQDALDRYIDAQHARPAPSDTE